MPQFDKRNTTENLFVGGSDIGLQVELTTEEAEAIYGAGALAGWYTFATFDGGTIAYEVEVERDKDESGAFTGKVIEKNQTFRLTNTIKETDDATSDLIDTVLSKTPHRYRYALPAKNIVVDPGPPEVVEFGHQMYGIYNGVILPGFEIPTTADEKRLRPITLESEADKAGNPAFVRATVYLGDEATWPASLADFKTDAP